MNVSKIVSQIILDVKRRGDTALCDYAHRFDKVRLKPSGLRVTSQELTAAQKHVSNHFMKAVQECGGRVKAFAQAEKKQLTGSWMTSKGISRSAFMHHHFPLNSQIRQKNTSKTFLSEH